jgi:VWFA-related protein
MLLAAIAVLPAWYDALAGQTKAAQPKDERKEPLKPELNSPQGSDRQQKDYKIGGNVNLVVVHTTVVDKNGQIVNGLKQDRFKIFEDGVMQNIVLFSREDVPVSLGIIVDTNVSMRNKIDDVTKAALAVIRASNPKDEINLFGFNGEVVSIWNSTTTGIDYLTNEINNMDLRLSGGTRLWDAIYVIVQEIQRLSRPKKVIIVISNGEDRDSYKKLDEMVAQVQRSDVLIYSIGLVNATPNKGPLGRRTKSEQERAHLALARISEETGAKAFFPTDVKEIHTIMSEIAFELNNQYSISYFSSNTVRDNIRRRIRVALDPSTSNDLLVRFRAGYFASKPGK